MKKKQISQAVTLAVAALLASTQAATAQAANVDHILVQNSNMSADLVNESAGQGGYIYGIVGGGAYVDNTTTDGTRGGVTGTFGKIDSNLADLMEAVNDFDVELPSAVDTVIDAVSTVDTVLSDKTEGADATTTLTGDAGLTLENYEKDWIRYYGAIGGDLSVNTGLGGTINYGLSLTGNWEDQHTNLLTEAETTSITRTGNISNTIESGTIIGGTGASAAAALGNLSMTVGYEFSEEIPNYGLTAEAGIDAGMSMNGETKVTVEGDVSTVADADANLIGWTNGGLAISLGGTATSTVTGDSTITIDGTDRADHEGGYEDPDNDAISPLTTVINVMKGSKVNAIGVAGGGTTISIMGGTAESTVGSTSVTVNNATVIGVAGGGVAASVDLTTIADLVYSSQGKDLATGNDNGELNLTAEQVADLAGITLPDGLDVTLIASDAIDGGTASSVTGDTNISLTGSTTAVGVTGGGIAAAVHTYTWKGDGTADGDNTVSAYGSSTATATSGHSTITIELEGDGDPGALSEAIQNIYTGFKTDSIQADDLLDLKDQGMAVGVFGGGTAVAYGDPDATMTGSDTGANATASTAGSDIYLNSGYAAGVFGGGAALAINTAHATAEMTDDVNITTASGMETIAIFGGGLAWSGEQTPNTGTDFMDTASATSTVETVNITNEGDTDGIFGGGVALGVSNRTGANDAVSTVEISNITVNDGTVSTVNMDVLMKALQNTNEDTWPQWSFMGFNVSSYMADIKGILDETAIVGGGLGLGLSGYADVETSSITINGGTVEGSILGGGIAVDNMNKGAGAHVGESTITLNGGTVNGSVYAGGAINKTTSQSILDDASYGGYNTDATSSTVGTATVILNGAEVTGEISGQGIEVTTDYSGDGNYNPFYNGNELTYEKVSYDESVDESTLIITGTNTLSPLDTTTGSYTSDSKIHDFNYINVEAGSTTVLEGLTAGDDEHAIIDGGLVTVDDSAYLDIMNLAQSDDAYYVAVNTDEDSTFWSTSNIIYDRLESLVDVDTTGNSFTITKADIDTDEKRVEATNRYVSDLDASPLREVLQSGYDNDWNVRSGAKNFFSDWAANPSASESFGRAALLGEDTAATANTVAIARVVTDNLTSRLSYIGDFATAPEAYGERGALWVEYIRNDFKADGLSSSFGSIDADGDFDGIMAGADFAVVGGVRLGGAFYYVNGDADGTISDNDYDGYGFALYGNYRNETYDFNIIGDIGYGRVSHDIEGRLNGKKVETDRDIDVFTIGLRAEKRFQVAQNSYVVPYTGIRYFNINAKDYDTKYGGEKLFDNDAGHQNIWTLPLGVSATHNFKLQSGWTVAPKVDVAYIWAFGDKDNDVKVDMGTGAHSSLNYKVVDDGSWRGAVGVDASYGTWGFALGYAYQEGDDIRDQKFFVNMSYAF